MTGRPFYFKLESFHPVPCSWYEAGKLLADPMGRCLRSTRLGNGTTVTTAFLVFDHNPFGQEPVLWNTIARDAHGNERLVGRYSCQKDAEKGHERAVAFLRIVQ